MKVIFSGTVLLILIILPKTSFGAEYLVKAKDISKLTCELALNAFNVDECTRALTNCTNSVMSRRINVPTHQGDRYILAVRECVQYGFGTY